MDPATADGRMPTHTMGHGRTHNARSITAEEFAIFLRRLDDDADRAAAEYEKLRLALVKFFDWRGAWAPDDCADETVDRLVAKLGGEVQVEDVRSYAHGIARLVLLERRRQQSRIPIAEHADLSGLSVHPSRDADPLPECFDACLARLPGGERVLALQYYTAAGQTKIENRRRLARLAGISDNALRSRVHRLRDRLERCAQRCAASAETLGLDEALRHVTADLDTVQQRRADGD